MTPNSPPLSEVFEIHFLDVQLGDYYAAARICGAPVPPPQVISRAVTFQVGHLQPEAAFATYSISILNYVITTCSIYTVWMHYFQANSGFVIFTLQHIKANNFVRVPSSGAVLVSQLFLDYRK